MLLENETGLNPSECRNQTYLEIVAELPERRKAVFEAIEVLKKPVSAKEICRAMGVPINHVTGRITELLKQGLIIVSKQDREGRRVRSYYSVNPNPKVRTYGKTWKEKYMKLLIEYDNLMNDYNNSLDKIKELTVKTL